MTKQEEITPLVEEILEDNPLASIRTVTEQLNKEGIKVSRNTVHIVAASLRDAGDVSQSNIKALQVEEGGLYLLRRIQNIMSNYLDRYEDEPGKLSPLIDMSTHLLMVIAGMGKRRPVEKRIPIKLPKLSTEDMRKISKGDMTPLAGKAEKTGVVVAGHL